MLALVLCVCVQKTAAGILLPKGPPKSNSDAHFGEVRGKWRACCHGTTAWQLDSSLAFGDIAQSLGPSRLSSVQPPSRCRAARSSSSSSSRRRRSSFHGAIDVGGVQ
jgi:hypothetical protein